MPDLDHKERAEPTKIVGANTNGEETDYLEVTPNHEARTSDVVNTAAVYSEITVGTTAVELKVGASALANRKVAHVTPKDKDIYWGYDNLVTPVTGTKIFKGATVEFNYGPNISIWLIAESTGNKANIGEAS